MNRSSLKKSNDNGTKFQHFATYLNRVIAGICFGHKQMHRSTWKLVNDNGVNKLFY